MNTPTRLEDVPVELVGAGQGRGLVERIFADVFGARPTGSGKVKIVFGEKSCVALMGPERFREIQAPSKWGDKRLTYRSAFHPYCIGKDGGWLVTCVHPSSMPRTRWLERASIEAAISWAIHLAKGGKPVEPPSPRYRSQDWRV